MTGAARPRLRWSGAMALAVLGAVAVPLVLWLAVPTLPARLESSDGFLWAGVEPGTGRPVLLREQDDGAEILAGSDRYGIPRREAVLCYDGPGELLRDAAMARGRVEALTLHTGWFRRLTVTTDDLGGPTTTYVYRCGARGALPVLAWGAARSFGLRALSTTWLVWLGAMLVVRAVLRRLR